MLIYYSICRENLSLTWTQCGINIRWRNRSSQHTLDLIIIASRRSETHLSVRHRRSIMAAVVTASKTWTWRHSLLNDDRKRRLWEGSRVTRADMFSKLVPRGDAFDHRSHWRFTASAPDTMCITIYRVLQHHDEQLPAAEIEKLTLQVRFRKIKLEKFKS